MSALTRIALMLLVTPAVARAEIIGLALSTRAPPFELGPYEMIPFPPDPTPLWVGVTSVAGPTGELLFDIPLNQRRIGQGWATWNHGYDGDVYYTNAQVRVGLTLPPDTGAFILYAESARLGWYEITAVADSAHSITQSGSGAYAAVGYAFYATAGDELRSIIVSSGADFAIGEFLIAPVPEPATLVLLSAVVLVLVRRR